VPAAGPLLHDLAFMFERVRISDESRCEQFLDIWKHTLRCKMVKMTCEEHVQRAANSQFVTHVVGRVLGNGSPIEPPAADSVVGSLPSGATVSWSGDMPAPGPPSADLVCAP
jgi:hypothetical protein